MTSLWTEAAWLGGRWQANVLLEVDGAGRWSRIQSGQACPPHARRLKGAVLPPLVNAHSHAFQRAMAGLAERREQGQDDFWSWRDAMYGVALRITPDELRRVATRLYRELLLGGYTQVVEFHYLQHREDGQAYDNELAMAWALADAAREVGIGLTLLPVLYAHQGFGTPGLRTDQRRFKTDADWVWRACEQLRAGGVNAGVALHSLRAAHPGDVDHLLRLVGDTDLPIHIHVAEQTAEVEACVRQHGQRPVQWLAPHLDARWQLVHATHLAPDEVEAIARSGAGVVLCPGTEANLGDGLPPLRECLNAGIPLTLGSDSQVTREWREELRWLEYTQRLLARQRNVCAEPAMQPSTAARLFDAVHTGAARAAGLPVWGLKVGARADWLVIDPAAEGLEEVPLAQQLDALVFASRGPCFAEVGVAGQPVLALR